MDRLDPEEVARFAFRVWSYKQGEMVSLLIHLGDRLGLTGDDSRVGGCREERRFGLARLEGRF